MTRTTTTEAVTIGQRVKNRRAAAGWTGKRLHAETTRLGLPIAPASLCFIEKGYREPSGPQLRVLALAFGCSLDDLGHIEARRKRAARSATSTSSTCS